MIIKDRLFLKITIFIFGTTIIFVSVFVLRNFCFEKNNLFNNFVSQLGNKENDKFFLSGINPNLLQEQNDFLENATTSININNEEDINLGSNFKSDYKNQLVRHLFNVYGVPSPKSLVFSKDGKEIWVSLLLNKRRGISVFDSLTGEKIKDINLDNGGGVEIIFSDNGNKAYVSQMETAKVFEIDTKSKEILRVFNTGSTWTKMMTFSPDAEYLFASNWCGNNVSEIDLKTGELIRQIPTVRTPRGIYITKDGKTLYVAGFDKGEIEKIDLETGLGEVIFESGGAIRHIVADEDKNILYVSDMGKNVIWKVLMENDKVEEFVKTDTNPNTIQLSPNKKILFVSCRGKNYSSTNYYIPGPEWGSVLLFDVETGKMLDAIIAGNQPTALDISPDGHLLIFSDFLDGRLEFFEIPSYEVLIQGDGGRSGVYKEELQK